MIKLIVPVKAQNMVTHIMNPAHNLIREAGAVILLAELEDLVAEASKVPYTQQEEELAVLVAKRIRELRREVPE
jgi:hypothetical protein